LVLKSILKACGLRLELGTWGAKGKLEMWGDIMDEIDIDLKLQATKLLMKCLELPLQGYNFRDLFHMYFTIFNSNPKDLSSKFFTSSAIDLRLRI
jgi:hypothetical protein